MADITYTDVREFPCVLCCVIQFEKVFPGMNASLAPGRFILSFLIKFCVTVWMTKKCALLYYPCVKTSRITSNSGIVCAASTNQNSC